MIPRRVAMPRSSSCCITASRSTREVVLEPDHERLVVRRAVRRVVGQHEARDVRERGAVRAPRARRRSATIASSLAQLHEADRRLEVRHAEVEAELDVLLEHDGAARVPLVRRSRPSRARAGAAAAARARRRGVSSIPPSPVVRSLRGWKESATRLPAARRAGRGSVEPIAHAASSITATPRGAHTGLDRLHVGRHAGLVDDDHGAGRRAERALDRLGRQVLRLEVDVGEHRPRADVARRVGGGDERQRRHDDLVAAARRRARAGRGAARSCTTWSRRRAPRRARRTPPPRRRRPSGPARSSPRPARRPTASCLLGPSQGRMIGITSMRPPTSSRSARHHSTRLRRPSSSVTRARKPSCSAAREVSASRRATLFTARAGPCSTSGRRPSRRAARARARRGSSRCRWRR